MPAIQALGFNRDGDNNINRLAGCPSSCPADAGGHRLPLQPAPRLFARNSAIAFHWPTRFMHCLSMRLVNVGAKPIFRHLAGGGSLLSPAGNPVIVAPLPQGSQQQHDGGHAHGTILNPRRNVTRYVPAVQEEAGGSPARHCRACCCRFSRASRALQGSSVLRALNPLTPVWRYTCSKG